MLATSKRNNRKTIGGKNFEIFFKSASELSQKAAIQTFLKECLEPGQALALLSAELALGSDSTAAAAASWRGFRAKSSRAISAHF